MAEFAIFTRLAAQASTTLRGNYPGAVGLPPRPRLLWTAVMMGDIGEEITEIEFEPLPEEVPAEAPAEPAAEPTPA